MIDLELSRRGMILTALAGLLGVSGIDLEFLAHDRQGLLRDTLERLLRPFRMSDAEFARFETDYEKGRGIPKGLEVGVLNATGALGLTHALADATEHTRDKLDFFERMLLTEFVLATEIMDCPGEKHELTYQGLFHDRPCANPYARFD